MEDFNNSLWELLWGDVKAEEEFPGNRPILAHYTSATTLNAIFSSRQLWLSHPMLMNDIEELQWGVNAGIRIFQSHGALREACGSSEKFDELVDYFLSLINKDGAGNAQSIFAACFCDHTHDEGDGLLSMWRAYGANGGGAAIVFDTGKLVPRENSPFLLSPIKYRSAKDRETWISSKLDDLARHASSHESQFDSKRLSIMASYFFARLKVFALTTKHSGFSEEREWRLVYIPEWDNDKKFVDSIDYIVGASGFQPKMKLALNSEFFGDVSLSELVTQVMLGPNHGGSLGARAVERMLQKNGHQEIAGRVVQSTTPFRPT